MDTRTTNSGYRPLPLPQRNNTLYSSTLSARPSADEGDYYGSYRREERPQREYVSAYADESSVVRVTRRNERSSCDLWSRDDEQESFRDEADDRDARRIESRRTASASASAGLRERLSSGWRVFSGQGEADADDDFDEAYEDEYDYDDSYDEDYGDYEAYDEYEGYDDEYEQDSWRSNGSRRSYITDYSEPNKGFVGTLKDMGKNFSGASELANKAFSNLTDFRVLRVLIIVGVAVWVLNSLYTPVRNYYVANRQLDALQATYDAVTKESDDIRSELEYLQTHEGIEDVARTRGFVEPGDTKVIVEGLQDKGDTFNQPYHPTDTKVVEERTWYVEMLDNLFGYKPEA